MNDIFLSYADVDRERIQPLVRLLEQQDWTVWWDRRIPPGQKFDRVIETAIADSKCVLVVWSEHSVQSDWVRNEAAEGARRGVMVPVLIDDAQIPFEFRRIQASKPTSFQDESEAIRELLSSLGSVIGRAPPPAPPVRRDVGKVPRGVKKWWLLALGALVAVILALAVISRFDPSRAERVQQKQYAEEISKKYYLFSLGDASWANPNKMGFENEFLPKGETVYDAGTGIVWQRGGSSESMGFPEIAKYIRKLNVERFGGYSDWRLPTLAEAWSLLEPRQTQGVHIDPVFDPTQRWIWTDLVTRDGYGWFVSYEWGKPIFQNYWQSHAYVRAVRGETFK